MRLYSLIAASVLFSAQAMAQSFEPGLWKSKRTLRLNGIPMPDARDENCISGSQAKDVRTTIEDELKKQGCFLTKWDIKSKRLDADIKCDNKDLEASGKLAGDFTEKDYDLRGEAKGKYKRTLPSVAAITMTGEWIANKDCVKE